uniref:Uncharacterized protein n=1 Tax=viral metagenome TaxID=1070528 RepID=A0A6M3LZ79_9ZZZZ
MSELKKLFVCVGLGSAGEKVENFEGEDLKVFIEGSDGHPILKVKDGDEPVGAFQRWDYWAKVKEE